MLPSAGAPAALKARVAPLVAPEAIPKLNLPPKSPRAALLVVAPAERSPPLPTVAKLKAAVLAEAGCCAAENAG